MAQTSAGPEHFGPEIRQSGEEKARRRLDEELKRLGWRSVDLVERAKGDVEKIRVAKILRQETTMTLAWIAQALQMGTKTHLSDPLYWHGKEKKKPRSRMARY